MYGAGEWIRTTDLLITNQLLCQLSYAGKVIKYSRNRRQRTTCGASTVTVSNPYLEPV